ncbi:Nucleolar complex protein 4 [Gurleya vavrai]
MESENIYEFKKLIEQKNNELLLKTTFEVLKNNHDGVEYYDEAIIYLLQNKNAIDSEILFESLPELILYMQEPRETLDFVIKEIKLNSCCSFYAAQTLFFMLENCNVEYTNLYLDFYSLLTKKNIITHRTNFLQFIKIIFEDQNISLHCCKAYIKRLSRIALEIDSSIAIEILNLIFVLMKLHPICFEMCNEIGFLDNNDDMQVSFHSFQTYLYEFDILASGIQPIRKIINSIRNESYKKKETYDRKALLETNNIAFTDY